jgi:uncharacterized protein YprB with RNaseH-like and TPR domain
VLQNTFRHIPGIGPKTEHKLWSAGLHSWHTIQEHASIPLPARQSRSLELNVGESIARLRDGDVHYFDLHLPSQQHWRLFPEFRHSIAYLDIETTGLGAPGDVITTIVLYDGRTISHYVQGENLDAFRDDVEKYALLVTYNGKCFDLPFIRSYFDVPMPHAHIDLRYVLASLGYRGGLKGCERQLGIDRGDLVDVDGYFAVLLWRDYRRRGDRRALETLLAYNVLDVVNLETLMVMAYNLKLRDTPFADSHTLPSPVSPANPFQADRATIERIRRSYYVPSSEGTPSWFHQRRW